MWVAVIGEELLQIPEPTNTEEDSNVVWSKRILALRGIYLGKYQLLAPCFYSSLVRSAVVSLGQDGSPLVYHEGYSKFSAC